MGPCGFRKELRGTLVRWGDATVRQLQREGCMVCLAWSLMFNSIVIQHFRPIKRAVCKAL